MIMRFMIDKVNHILYIFCIYEFFPIWGGVNTVGKEIHTFNN